MRKNELNTVTFWERVNAELKKQGKTQIQLCKDCNFSIGSFRSKISIGSAPNVFDAQKIATYLNTTVEYLVTGSDTENTSGEIDELRDKLARIAAICADYNLQQH